MTLEVVTKINSFSGGKVIVNLNRRNLECSVSRD
jgi:hypothetical protein